MEQTLRMDVASTCQAELAAAKCATPTAWLRDDDRERNLPAFLSRRMGVLCPQLRDDFAVDCSSWPCIGFGRTEAVDELRACIGFPAAGPPGADGWVSMGRLLSSPGHPYRDAAAHREDAERLARARSWLASDPTERFIAPGRTATCDQALPPADDCTGWLTRFGCDVPDPEAVARERERLEAAMAAFEEAARSCPSLDTPGLHVDCREDPCLVSITEEDLGAKTLGEVLCAPSIHDGMVHENLYGKVYQFPIFYGRGEAAVQPGLARFDEQRDARLWPAIERLETGEP
jgi:hypothetical protein